jgi:DNA polymerase V
MQAILIGKYKKGNLEVPFFDSAVSAGFPSPADDFIENKLDLNELVVKHPAATYYVRAQGGSMKNAGISSGDVLVVDRSLNVMDGNIVIASIDGEFTVKRVKKINNGLYLVPENEDYKPIKIEQGDDFQVFGVVTYVVKKL